MFTKTFPLKLDVLDFQVYSKWMGRSSSLGNEPGVSLCHTVIGDAANRKD